MKPSEFKALIIQATNKPHFTMSDQEFQLFIDITMTVGSGETVLNNWKKFIENNNISVKDFFDWYVELELNNDTSI